MLMDLPIRYRRLRAPRESGQALVEPPLADVELILEQNRQRLDDDVELAGRPLAELRRDARRQLLAAACRYTEQYRDLPPLPEGASAPLLLSGHQPELFHPGVWFKNYVLSELAAQHGGIGVNLVIDSDAMKWASIFVPTGSLNAPRRERIAFDRPGTEVPHEERKILDRQQFHSFGQRACAAIAPFVRRPLLVDYWPLVERRAAETASLGAALAQGRHQLEATLGLQTLELPQSSVCRLEVFHWFTAHLLAHLPRVWEAYNAALAEYRRVHHLRSRAQPLPDLTADDQWLEAPYWIWSEADPVRRPLLVRSRGDELLLTNRAGWECRLPLTADGAADRAVEQLAALAAQGVKLRTRALATTMFARLVLSDLFLHGIGGAKYDQVTDRMIAQVFDLAPPAFLTATATLELPVAAPRVMPADAGQLRHELRALEYHPEQYVERTSSESGSNGNAKVNELLAEKQRWIRTPKTLQNARARHFEIKRLNEALQPWVAARRAALLAERETIAAQLQAASVLRSREYAFCLHNGETLHGELLEILRATS